MFRPLKPHQLIVDAIIAAVFGLIALWSELSGYVPRIELLGGVITGVLMAVALGLRRASPSLALTVAWVGAIVQMAFGRPPLFADLAIFAVLYTTAAYGSRRTFWAGFASAVLGGAVISGYLAVVPQFAGGRLQIADLPLVLVVLIAAVFALLLSWTFGALVRTRLRALAGRAAQQRAESQAAAEQERTRIARDMHDVVAHSLAVVIAQADGARYAAASDPSAAESALGTISSTARAALSDVRLLLTQLRHSQGEGPQPTLADLEQLYAQVRRSGVALTVDVAPVASAEPSGAVQLAVYRILQEALTNALRHGGGAAVGVRLAWHDDRVDLEVRNALAAGPGASGNASGSTAGHGVIGMRERAQLVGGSLTAVAEDGAFVVRATLPLGGDA